MDFSRYTIFLQGVHVG